MNQYKNYFTQPFYLSALRFPQPLLALTKNLNFELSSLDSEGFTQQILAFSGEVQGKMPRMSRQRTKDASKRPEVEEVKPKVQVKIIVG